MKNTRQSTIPDKLRKEMAEDPFYKTCCLYGQVLNGTKHECKGNVTWEHTLIYAGSKIQEKWAIIPLCEKYHGVNWYQDSGYLVKEVNVWVALNRATYEDLKRFSKAVNYVRERDRLNNLYGTYSQMIPPPALIQSPYQNVLVNNVATISAINDKEAENHLLEILKEVHTNRKFIILQITNEQPNGKIFVKSTVNNLTDAKLKFLLDHMNQIITKKIETKK